MWREGVACSADKARAIWRLNDREEPAELERCVVGKQASQHLVSSPSAGDVADPRGAHAAEFKRVPHQ